jgi:hypothetical protein
VRSSVKPSHATNDTLKDELIRRTCKVWQPRLGRDLSPEEARQIVANVAGFFLVLSEWSRTEMLAPANDASEPAAADVKEGAP